MENRNALIVDMELTQADGRAEREAATQMLGRLPGRRRRRTVAADKAYDTASFVASCRTLRITPHVAQNTTNRRSAIDARTFRYPLPQDQPADPQTHRRALRLDQDRRRRPQARVQGPEAQPRMVPDCRGLRACRGKLRDARGIVRPAETSSIANSNGGVLETAFGWVESTCPTS